MASDLQRSPTRPVQQNHADSNDFGDLISPETPSVVSSRIMQAKLPVFPVILHVLDQVRPWSITKDISRAREGIGRDR
jgi:hypothetical protein